VLLAIVLASSLTFNLGDLLFDCSVVINSFKLEEEVESELTLFLDWLILLDGLEVDVGMMLFLESSLLDNVGMSSLSSIVVVMLGIVIDNSFFLISFNLFFIFVAFLMAFGPSSVTGVVVIVHGFGLIG